MVKTPDGDQFHFDPASYLETIRTAPGIFQLRTVEGRLAHSDGDSRGAPRRGAQGHERAAGIDPLTTRG
jgi:hypothetical protein